MICDGCNGGSGCGYGTGPGGSNLKKVLSETGVQINPEAGSEASSTWSLFAPNSEALIEAKEIIEAILAEHKIPELEFGAIYPSIIKEIRERGVMVELHPELPLVLVPNSQLEAKKVSNVCFDSIPINPQNLAQFGIIFQRHSALICS